jgi:hypothetical protein
MGVQEARLREDGPERRSLGADCDAHGQISLGPPATDGRGLFRP